MNEIHLYAYCPGDPSVGIGDADFTVENIGSLDTYEGQRETVRRAFRAAFETLCDSPVRIAFSDERPQ